MRHLAWFLLVGLALAACGTNDPVADAMPGTPDAAPGTPDAAPADAALQPDAAAPGQCRSQADCPSANLCYGPNDPKCGIPPREECGGDGDCPGKGQVCHAIADGCSPDGVGSMCAQPCSGNTDCDEGFVCDDGGRCSALSCDNGFTCPPSQRCDPNTIDHTAPVHAITHGCVVLACTGTDDRSCLSHSRCVNDRCQDDFGTCSPPVP